MIKDKAFYFLALEGVRENLQRPNLSEAIGTPCPVSAPTLGANASLIATSADCQRLALLNFFQYESRPGRRAAGSAPDQQQRGAGESRLDPLADEQLVRVVQLRLLEEPESDVRRPDIRNVGKRHRRPVEDQRR